MFINFGNKELLNMDRITKIKKVQKAKYQLIFIDGDKEVKVLEYNTKEERDNAFNAIEAVLIQKKDKLSL